MSEDQNIFVQVAKFLIETGSQKCITKGNLLKNESTYSTSLHLRSLELTSQDILSFIPILRSHTETTLTSISFSYNLIGDEGAIALAKCFPKSIQEIGLVGCGIGDQGGKAILKWAKNVSQLQMICIEQNNFSAALKGEFEIFQKSRPNVMIVT